MKKFPNLKINLEDHICAGVAGKSNIQKCQLKTNVDQ
jgi:hypothetical protein